LEAWRCRNECVFNGAAPSIQVVLRRIFKKGTSGIGCFKRFGVTYVKVKRKTRLGDYTNTLDYYTLTAYGSCLLKVVLVVPIELFCVLGVWDT